MKQELSKKSLESICEIALGSFHGLMCKYSIDGFLYYNNVSISNPANSEAAGNAAMCLLLIMLTGGVAATLYFDGFKKLYKSIGTKNEKD